MVLSAECVTFVYLYLITRAQLVGWPSSGLNVSKDTWTTLDHAAYFKPHASPHERVVSLFLWTCMRRAAVCGEKRPDTTPAIEMCLCVAAVLVNVTTRKEGLIVSVGQMHWLVGVYGHAHIAFNGYEAPQLHIRVNGVQICRRKEWKVLVLWWQVPGTY